MNKLEYRNNWESDIYSVNGKEIVSLTSVCINDVIYPVTGKIVSVPYTDMGHIYYGISIHYFVETEVFGVIQEVNLNSIVNKIDVEAVEYQVKNI